MAAGVDQDVGISCKDKNVSKTTASADTAGHCEATMRQQQLLGHVQAVTGRRSCRSCSSSSVVQGVDPAMHRPGPVSPSNSRRQHACNIDDMSSIPSK